jgi:hypothetical protein
MIVKETVLAAAWIVLRMATTSRSRQRYFAGIGWYWLPLEIGRKQILKGRGGDE